MTDLNFDANEVLGPLLIGTYLNSIMYALEGVAVIQYYSASKLCTCFTCACVYLYTVTHWGDINFVNAQFWPSAVSLLLNGITGTIVHCFLIYRYWKMSQNHYVTSVLVLFMLAASGGSIAASVTLLLVPSTGNRNWVLLSALIWFTTAVATDVAITLALLWQFYQIKSSFKTSMSLIHRLMASTIRTGTITSVVSVLVFLSFSRHIHHNEAVGFVSSLGRTYALTMLYNLNYRSSLRHSPANYIGTHSLETGITMNGIHVNRTATVHYESSTDHGPLDLSDRSQDVSDSFSTQEKVSTLPLGP
jgi:hypothetical protein